MRKLFSLFAALTLSVGLWAQGSVFTYTATEKLETQFLNLGAVDTHDFNDGVGTVTYYSTITEITNDAFNSCSALQSITLPASILTIGGHAFSECTALQSITLPATLTTVGEYAFFYCTALQSITLPATLMTIGESAFEGCEALQSVTCKAIVPPTCGDDAFDNTSIPLYVPAGTTATYAAADQWKDFGSIVEPAPTPVSTTYLDENGVEQNIDAFEVKDASEAVTWGTAGQTTWFVVKGTNVQLSKGAICAGDVRLILADNAQLTATGVNAVHTPGIQVSGEGNSLTIYGQTAQSGQLIANGVDNAAGIGGGYEGSGSNITINSGKVTAKGGDLGAGIGGGNHGDGFNITINGGIVTATGGYDGAGIGGGEDGSGSNITINGGEVTAIGGYEAAGIGGGMYGSGSYITINGGTVTANGGEYASGIGGGRYKSCSDTYISDAYVLKAGAAADPTEVIAHSSATDMAGTLTQRYVKIQGLATPYTRTVTANSWGTVCLPYDATSFEGADFYKVNYYDASNPSDLKLYIEPVDNLVAGMPYIFQATAETVIINHNATAPEAVTAGNENGLYGSFARKTIAYDAEHAYAAIAGGAVNVVEEEYNITVPACRAYLDMDEVPTVEQPHNAPLRCMGVPRQQPTDLETVDGSQCTMHTGKYIINGQFVIVKDGKKYNALGF